MLKKYVDSAKKIIYVFNKKQKRAIGGLVVKIVIGTLLELLGVTAVLPFITLAMNPESLEKNDLLSKAFYILNISNINTMLAILAAALILIYVVKNLYLTWMYYSVYKFTYSNQRKLAYRLLKCYLDQPYSFFLDHNSSALIENFITDVVQFFDIVLCLMMLFVEVLVCGLLVGYLIITDKTITISIIFILVLYFILFFKVLRKTIKKKGEIVRNSRNGMTKWLMQSFGGIKETKISRKEQYFLNKYDKEYAGFEQNHCMYQTLSYIPKPAMETVVISVLLIVVVFKLLRGVDSSYFVSTVSVFGVAAVRLLPAFNRISGYLSRITFCKVSVDRIYKDLKDVEVLESQKQENIEGDNLVFDKEIVAQNISYRYPTGDKNVLENANIIIPKNKSVAFIGPSGAGKTTMADIILGILYPQEGTIKVDGVSISGDMACWKKKLGYIPQAIFLMDDTIKNNIAYGVEETDIDEKRIEEVLEESQLKAFIDTLPDGIDTQIGERGIRLSGGQKQRIGIARALYNDPEILVLDEATSALDTETETAVMEAIDNLSGKKTLLIIAHRLSTIENCDIVYEIKDNKVIKKK